MKREIQSGTGWRRGGALGLAFLLGGCMGDAATDDALAATSANVTSVGHFVVDRADDSLDGVCATDGSAVGRCNLRAALAAATFVPGVVEIELAVDSSITLGEIAVAPRAVESSTSAERTTIQAAAGTAIEGEGHSRLFNIAVGADLALRGVRVSHFGAFDGGAIVNQGRLELDGATLSHNRASCAGVGAMTAYATCAGGAISSSGDLVLTGGTRFEDDAVTAEAYTASFTTSSGSGGAIASSGSILVDGPVVFADNAAAATSYSGVHPMPFDGAWATAAGGAIYSAGGEVVFTERANGRCVFSGNSALASANALHQAGVASAEGGAIWSNGTLVMAPDACSFVDNAAATAPDIHADPAPIVPGTVEHIDQATQTIVFTPGPGVAWADIHVRVNGGREANLRMRAGANGSFVVGPLALVADDLVSYSFTYFAQNAGHDTAVFSHVVPLTFEPKALRPEVRAAITSGAYAIRLVSSAPVDWADVHYSVNGGPTLNARLHDVGGVPGQVIGLAVGDRLDYWMTYSANGSVFETGSYAFRPTAPTAALLWTHGFPAYDPSTPPGIPDGCYAEGTWYACDEYAGSRVYTSGATRLENDADVVPFQITGTGPYGTSLIKTMHLVFQHLGGAPHTGVGLVQLPTSAASANGVPPADAADRDFGKYVNPAWNLRASYLIGGEGLSVALVDVNGLRSKQLDVVTYRGTYCRYGCSLKVPVAALVAGTDVDLNQIRYVELRTESGSVVDETMTIGHILFDDFAF